MLNKLTKILVMMVALAMGGPLLHAQTSNRVWFAIWNGQPTPSSDVAAQYLATSGGGSLVTNLASLVSQTNFPSFNSPYDIVVDTAMGKAYVLDNNMPGATPQYIYSFNLAGTPAQVAASGQVVYTLPVPQADVNSNIYPVISGLALDSTYHYLYFNQFDPATGTNSYIGRLSLAGSAETDAFSTNNTIPTLRALYAGQIPGAGAIAIDATNFYLGAYNILNGTNGVYLAPLSGGGAFSELVTISAGDTTFAHGIIGGVASVQQSNLVYYLTSNAGALNHNYAVSQNAIWAYNTVTHATTLIASNYLGYPDNIAVDPANKRYYFTVGQDGTGNASPTDYQAIYTGVVGSTNKPATFYVPALSGQDVAGGANAGAVSLQGIFIQDISSSNAAPVAQSNTVTAVKNQTLEMSASSLIANDTDPNGGSVSIVAAGGTSTNGGSVQLSGNYVFYTPATNFVGQDQFTYTLGDSEGSQAQATVHVNVISLGVPPLNFLTIGGVPRQPMLLFEGESGVTYWFQYANSLSGPWINLSPALTAGNSGGIEWNDLSAPGTGMRFYRVTSGQ